ncbi:arsenate reductase (glutaredoxin) [Gordonia neofelifaecis]|uniref:Arsenate reductase (ArsC) n=1 Tax=Gordonia neofelifaecis NRRL B-59395 TaxID=644548 RepID=F1YN88_9ACTN|nr:arsenate reductase (glutaredoxin) [Gordonia neofelifaecis]EGD53799.1 arsenate reductase (ArsC) [Gordonia neofelifaecis NRRL B-59395]
MDATIYYNQSCSKSRHALDTLRQTGADVHVVEYLTETPDRATLAELISSAGLSVRDAVRTGEPVYAELDLDGADDDALLDAMVANPSLIQRPLVVADGATVMARTPESLQEIVDRLARRG